MEKILMVTANLILSRLKVFLIVIVSLELILLACNTSHKIATKYAGENWSEYAGDNTKSRYSTLTQINRQNVSQLKLAWQYRSGDFSTDLKTTIECNPVVVNGVLYGTTPGINLTEKDLTNLNPKAHAYALDVFKKSKDCSKRVKIARNLHLSEIRVLIMPGF